MATQSIINSPPNRGGVDEENDQGRVIGVSKPWRAFFDQVFSICFADAQSGTTAQRPTNNLYPGRPYFDVSLGANGKKIFCDKNAAGVWIDSSGNVV